MEGVAPVLVVVRVAQCRALVDPTNSADEKVVVVVVVKRERNLRIVKTVIRKEYSL